MYSWNKIIGFIGHFHSGIAFWAILINSCPDIVRSENEMTDSSICRMCVTDLQWMVIMGRRWNWVLNNNHKRAVLPLWMECWWSSYGIDSHKKETKSVIDYCNINKTPLARYLSVIYLYFTLRDVLARFLNVRCSVGHCPGYEGPWSAVINNSIYRRGSFSRGIERGEKTLDSQTVVGI